MSDSCRALDTVIDVSDSYVLRCVHSNKSMCLRLCSACRFVCLVHSREERIDVGSNDKASANLAKHT